MSARIDADVGGTFTDVLLQREDGSIALRKVLSTLPDYDRAVVARRMRLARGQEIAVEVDEAAGVTLTLEPGEMSLHHIGVVHGSKPTRSDESRNRLCGSLHRRRGRPERRRSDCDAGPRRGAPRQSGPVEPPRDTDSAAVAARRDEVIRRVSSNLMPEE